MQLQQSKSCLCVKCLSLPFGSYPVQDETCHSSAMYNRMHGPIECSQCGLAMWAHGATCWMNAEHTVPTVVKVHLIKRFGK